MIVSASHPATTIKPPFPMHTAKRLPVSLGSTSAFKVDVYFTETPDYAIARSTSGEIGVTWNRAPDRPNGFPHSYSNQQWFILPQPLANLVLAGVDLFADTPDAQ